VTDSVEIYECCPEDVDNSLRALWLGLASEMFEIEHYTVPSEANGDRWVKFVREGLTSGKNFLLAAKDKNKLVGFAYASLFRDFPLEVTGTIGVINDVYVLPELRGRGIGRKLVERCLSKMKAEGVDAVRLTVLTENKAVVELYEKLGFKICRYGMLKPFKH